MTTITNHRSIVACFPEKRYWDRPVKNFVAHGVCPCCKRTFQDLARHMSGKHPTYAQEKGHVR